MKNCNRLFYLAILSFYITTVNAAPIIIEHSGSTTGINAGFGNVFGSESTLSIDSTLAGDISFALSLGAGNLNDTAVIYIDTDNGASGITNTSALNDTADNGRAAISGSGSIINDTSDLGFAPGFSANFAIPIQLGFAGVFELSADPLTFVSTACCAPLVATDKVFQLSFNLADIGLNPGGSFGYFLTYLNPSNGFRSNEFHGVSAATVGGIGNIGNNPFELGVDDYVHFTSVSNVPVPPAILLMLSGLFGFSLFFKKRSNKA